MPQLVGCLRVAGFNDVSQPKDAVAKAYDQQYSAAISSNYHHLLTAAATAAGTAAATAASPLMWKLLQEQLPGKFVSGDDNLSYCDLSIFGTLSLFQSGWLTGEGAVSVEGGMAEG
jgi:hypothetical protein